MMLERQNVMRHRKSTSSLAALDFLDLPSPPLSPTLLNTSPTASSSGEIPIMFSFLTTNPTPSPSDGLPQIAGGLRPVLPALARFSPMSAFFPMHNSVDSIDTQAFGHSFGLSRASTDSDSSSSSPSSPADLLCSPKDCSPVVQIFDYDADDKHLGDSSAFTISAYLDSPPICSDSYTALHSSHQLSVVDVPSDRQLSKLGAGLSATNELDLNATVTQRSSKSRASILPINVQPPSREPSVEQDGLTPGASNFDDETPTQSSFLKKRSSVGFPLGKNDNEANLARLPGQISPRKINNEIRQLRNVRQDFAPEKYHGDTDQYCEESEVTIKLELPNLLVTSASIQEPKSSFLPVPSLKHARWLKDLVVELWIDQEGFRAVRPQFHLASVSSGLPVTPLERSTFSVEGDDPLYTTVAEFLPVKRIAYPFHHAPLDRDPCLTRVSVAGDEARDFVTRTASLPLRENGVFFVSGTEDTRIEQGRVVRLAWRFEYFVAQRITTRARQGASGAGGERLLTPLSFSCTPALLDQSRAHKVTVLHIMKKTVLPNLVAQKLEPPDIPSRTMTTSDISLDLDTSLVLQGTDSDLKKRAVPRSRLAGETLDDQTPMQASFVPSNLRSPLRPPLRYTKHRRASRSDPDATELANEKGFQRTHARSISLSDQDTIKASNVKQFIAGPIIPRDELIKMFDNENDKMTRKDGERRRRADSLRFEVVDNVKMTLLPAPPRRKKV